MNESITRCEITQQVGRIVHRGRSKKLFFKKTNQEITNVLLIGLTRIIFLSESHPLFYYTSSNFWG